MPTHAGKLLVVTGAAVAEVGELPPLVRTAMHLHLAICPSCRRYRGQLTLMHRILLHLHDYPPVTRAERLSPTGRARLRLALKRGIEGHGRFDSE